MADERRIAKLEKAIAKEISEALVMKLRDPRGAGIVTITAVKITKDLSRAKVGYSVLGGEGERRNVAKMFESSHGFLQTLVAQRLDTRTVPTLVFYFDESIARQAEMSALLDDALASDREAQIKRGEISAPLYVPEELPDTASDSDDDDDSDDSEE